MSTQFPRPSIRPSHEIKGSNLNQESPPKAVSLPTSSPASKSRGGGHSWAMGTYPKETPINDRLAVNRSSASSLGLNQTLFQRVAPTKYCPWDDLGLSSLFFSTNQDGAYDDSGTLAGPGLHAKPATFWVSAASETTMSSSPLSLWQLE